MTPTAAGGRARLATIGVYGFTADGFLAALRSADVALVLDVRQRRGVRGAEYAWANSLRLQAALAGAGIAYEHHRELAPTTEMRRVQYREDAKAGVGKRNRSLLAPEYARLYSAEVLERADLAALVRSLPRDARAALMCVERDAPACHRSLIATRLAERHGAEIVHISPA